MQKKAMTRTHSHTKTRKPMRSGSVRASPRAKRISKKQIQWAIDRLVESLQPEKIILFGSYAYGKPSVDSDVDVLIIMESDERWTTRTTNAYRAVRGKTFPMDLIVRTPSELSQRLEIDDWFFKDILERGQILYERRNG